MVLHPYHQGGPGGLGGPPNQGNNPRMMHHHSFTPRYPMKPRGPTTQAALLSQQAAAAANKAPGTDADFDGKRPRKSPNAKDGGLQRVLPANAGAKSLAAWGSAG
ncbi:unnamed protein product [Lepeophtheirus salmonis]|uniref:(salmon louse) hypothetical protein n=1 Tax=Lepeophtheirus salmonis TaxID=72036 RepID=A0A7R8H680_LEPSM|nr:unnamed protein product [Lepeophtheirus salmonis]CAF2894582.1 unnamed protein product [Lepeophtheirus salmonis]